MPVILRLSVVLVFLANGSRALAQEPGTTALAAGDTVLSMRAVATEGADFQATFFMDSVCSVRVAEGLTLVSRPVAWRSRSDDSWHGRIAQLTARYEAASRIGMRLEGGFLAPPVGLGALEVRADTNPTILSAISSDQALPAFDPGVPRLALYAMTYPLGAQASFSGPRWDARLAVLDSSVLRSRSPFIDNQPAPAAQFLTGGGVTPVPGFRVGGWWSRGVYARAEEIATGATSDRWATLGGVETEYAIAHTRAAGEVIFANLDTSTGTETAASWMVEASQALTPRWFIAGRARRMEAPSRAVRVTSYSEDEYDVPCAACDAHPAYETSTTYRTRLRQTVGEMTAGYRLSRELTLRAGVFARRPYGEAAWNQGAAASVVWARRWF
jgi:hypothetical protein